MAAIPARLQDRDFRFVLLGDQGEWLKRPFEDGWDETANYRYDDPRLLDHLERANYGVCGGYADLHILDSDDLTRWDELGVLGLVPPTFTVESRPEHRQFYLKCKELFSSGGLFDPEKTEINAQGKPEHIHIGDLKAGAKDGICGGQAVGPSSRHPGGSIYTVVKDLPIAEVSSEVLRSILSRFKTTKKVNTNYQRLEENKTKAQRLKYTAKDPLARLRVADVMPPDGNVSQSGDELRGDHPVHGSKNGGNYVINIRKNVWHCKRCESGGDVALALAVKHRIISCADAGPKTLDATLYKEVLKIAKREYLGGSGGQDVGDVADFGAGGRDGRQVGGQEMGKEEEAPEILPLCDVKELLDTFKKWLYVTEDYNIVGPSVAAMANFCPGEPDIIGVIGPSGSIKTELIRSLGETQNQFVYPISSITEHTLCSGHKESRDLLPQLKGRLLTIKDLTSILSKKEEVRGQIFADFREISDGYIHKEFGNGVIKEYRDLHSSILFASTNAIERYYSMYANLGQRIIFLRPKNDSEKARERAFQNRGKQKEMRQELHATMTAFVSSIKATIETRGLPLTSDEVQEEMGPFYDFLAIARTPIHRDYKTDEIDEIPEPEFPTRICNTISRLCEVHALIFSREEVGPDDKAFGLRVILDNIPTRRWQILRNMPSRLDDSKENLIPGWSTTSSIATGADMSTEAAKRTLAELISLKLIERWVREDKTDGMDKRADSYRILDKWAKTIEKLRGVIRCDGTIDSEKELESDSSNEFEYTVIKNSPPLYTIIIPGGVEKDPPFSEDYLNDVLVCRRIKKAISEGIKDPIALSSICGLPICMLTKFPGVNSIAAARIQAKLEAHRREQHFQEKADKVGGLA